MVPQVPPALAAADALRCLGLGVLLAVLYDGVRSVLGGGRRVRCLLDLAGGLLAAVLVCSFAAGRSAAGAVRWYMTAGLAAGLSAWLAVLAPVSRRVQRLLHWLLRRPLVLCRLLVLHPLKVLSLRAGRRVRAQMQRKSKKRRKKQHRKQLQKQGEVLYNSR